MSVSSHLEQLQGLIAIHQMNQSNNKVLCNNAHVHKHKYLRDVMC